MGGGGGGAAAGSLGNVAGGMATTSLLKNPGQVKDWGRDPVGAAKNAWTTSTSPIKTELGGREKEQAADKRNDLEANINKQWEDLGNVNKAMTAAGQKYSSAMSPLEGQYGAAFGHNEGEYQTRVKSLMDAAGQQAVDASKVYDETILPNAKSYLERARNEAQGAMTLQQAQDPNNQVAQSFRNFYENQAQGEGKQGLADVGVLQSLGAQAFQNQMGNGPLTGAQMQLLQAGSQAQAGQAFANVQKRIQNLRDQGVQQGWEQTDKAYDRGQQAVNRWGSANQGLQDIQNQYLASQAANRGERAGYSGDLLGSTQRVAQNNYNLGAQAAERDYGLSNAALTRDAGLISGRAGAQNALMSGDIQALNAQAAAKAQMIPGLMGAGGAAVGGIFGGMFGGPMGGMMGAQAGQQAGSQTGGALAAPMMPQNNPGVASYMQQQPSAYNAGYYQPTYGRSSLMSGIQ